MVLDVYIIDEDQPTTCPKCGARTDFIEVQHHKCLNEECNYEFNGVFELTTNQEQQDNEHS